ncbi:hypothetical protein LOTGIDRAFT_171763 [Lottia gigantea]|uniref:Ionotropic glutamate receptor L-glutamate and glycine-binding domain-containing protein n=1 Tax=Lottia gigantea TaxID=225164 RepID=V4AYJ3_LOTGI|nr:hypothetical protein LOTGIDRAFT_171763 [Lottia gigantea]ESP02688.1 hypothetical protein LOTGIDRAFT_171763 [Lottia gigantea]
MKRVSKGKYAFVSSEGGERMKIHGDCSLEFNDRLFNVPNIEYSMAVPKGSLLKTEIDDFVDKIENSGLLDEIMKPQDNRQSQCGVIDQTVKPLFLDNVKGVFVLLAGGVVIAGITLVIENVRHYRRASGTYSSGGNSITQVNTFQVSDVIYLLQQLSWKKIVIVHDSDSDEQASELVSHTRGHPVYSCLIIQKRRERFSSVNIQKAFIQVHEHCKGHQKSYLIPRSKWLIFPSSWCSSFMTSGFQTNLTNVAVVIPSNSRCIGILTLNGNMFESVQGVPTGEKIFPNIRYKLNGKKIIIGVVPDNPFEKNYYNILHTMSRYLNFTYDIVNSTNSEYGILRNGTWSGLVGQLVNHEIDLGLTSLSTIEDRRNAVDFINPFGTSKPGILYKRELLVGDSWFLLTRPLQFKVYLCTIISFICVSLFFIFLSNRESNDQHGNRIANTVEFVLAALLLEGGNFHLKGTSARILFSFWLMFGVVLAATYTATLLRSLVPKQKEPFETIKGLLDLPDWQIGVLGGTAEIIVFNTSENNDVKMFWKTLNSRTQKDANIQSTDTNVHMKRVSQGKYAFLTLDGRAIIKVHGDCSLKFNDRLFNVPSTEYSMAVPQGSVLKTELDDFVDKIENSGLLDEMMKPQDNRPSQCGVIDQRVKPLFLDNVKGVFALLAGGVVVAGITLVVEKVLHLRRASGSIR